MPSERSGIPYRQLPTLDAVALEWARRHLPALGLPSAGGAQRAVEMWLARRPPYEASHYSWRIVRRQWMTRTGGANPLKAFGPCARTPWGRMLATGGLWVGDVLSTSAADRAERYLRSAGAMRRTACGAWDPLPPGSRLFVRGSSADATVCVFVPVGADAFQIVVRDGNRAYATRRRDDAHRRLRAAWAAAPATKATFLRAMRQKATRAGARVRLERAARRT